MNFITPEFIVNKRFENYQKPKWKYAVICFRDYLGSKIIIEKFNAKPVGRKFIFGLEELEGGEHVYEAQIDGEKIGIITRCNWGGPQAAIIIEELAYLGVEYIIGYGAAGGINEEYRKGDQVVAISGILTDGTSKMYNDASLCVNDELLVIAKEVSKKNNIDLRFSKFATVDALYRESHELINKWRDEGVDAISMETTTFYAVANACKVKSIWIGHISDTLFKKWDDWGVERKEMSQITAQLCKEVIVMSIKNNG